MRNNIIVENGEPGDLNVKVFTMPRSEVGYDADYNLVYPANYEPAGLRGVNDLNSPADFADVTVHIEPEEK